jgi:hypothetical protein
MKKKKITKKLTFVDPKNHDSYYKKLYKEKKKSFKYFDPSRAPPISSLRSNS